jgi:hypothetical protein
VRGNRVHNFPFNLIGGNILLAVLGGVKLQPLVTKLLHKIYDVALHQPLRNLLRLRRSETGKQLCNIVHYRVSSGISLRIRRL